MICLYRCFSAFVDGVHFGCDGFTAEGVIVDQTFTDDGWAIEVAIPKALFNIKAGDNLKLRIGEKTLLNFDVK